MIVQPRRSGQSAETGPASVLAMITDLRADADRLRGLLAEVITAGQPTADGGITVTLPPIFLDRLAVVLGDHDDVTSRALALRLCPCGCGGLR